MIINVDYIDSNSELLRMEQRMEEVNGLLADREVRAYLFFVARHHRPSVFFHVYAAFFPSQAQLAKSKQDMLQQRDKFTKVVS